MKHDTAESLFTAAITAIIVFLLTCHLAFCQELTGTTLYELSGPSSPAIIEGRIVASEVGNTAWTPFGFVRYPVSGEVQVTAEAEDRTQLPVEKFGDGWRIDATGPVWVEARVYQTLTIDGQELRVIRDWQQTQFVIEGPTPAPVDPVEPTTDNPFSDSAKRVLIVYERDELTTLPESQTEVIYSTKLRNWLRANGFDFRVLDKDVVQVGEDALVWCDALSKYKDLPWLMVGNGDRGYSGALPETTAKTLELLEGLQ